MSRNGGSCGSSAGGNGNLAPVANAGAENAKGER
jgi:hypothetical protein